MCRRCGLPDLRTHPRDSPVVPALRTAHGMRRALTGCPVPLDTADHGRPVGAGRIVVPFVTSLPGSPETSRKTCSPGCLLSFERASPGYTGVQAQDALARGRSNVSSKIASPAPRLSAAMARCVSIRRAASIPEKTPPQSMYRLVETSTSVGDRHQLGVKPIARETEVHMDTRLPRDTQDGAKTSPPFHTTNFTAPATRLCASTLMCAIALFSTASASAQVDVVSDAELSANSVGSVPSFAPAGRILEQGPGFQLLETPDLGLEDGDIVFDDGDGPDEVEGEHHTYAFTDFTGLMSADLPMPLKQELMREYGAAGPEGLLLIDVDAAREAFSNHAPPVSWSAKGLLDFDPCPKKRIPRTKFKEIVLTPKQKTKQVSGGGFSGTVSYNSGLEGKIKATINYVKKERCDFTYGAEFTGLNVQGHLEFKDSEVRYAGTAFKLDRKTVVQMELLDLEYSLRFGAGPVVFEALLGAEVNAGLDVQAEARAGIGLRAPVKGRYSFDYECDAHNCRKVRPVENTIDFDLEDLEFQGEVDLRAKVIPWLEVHADAKVGLYTEKLRIGRAKIGARVAIPAMLWGYIGNMCGDADGDGRNESVTAAIVDINADLYAYLEAKLFGSERRWGIDLDLDAPWELMPRSEVGSKLEEYTYRRHLRWRDYVDGGSTALSPMIQEFDGGEIKVSARPCLPHFAKRLTYAVDLDDAGMKYVTGPASGVRVDHIWQSLGRRQVAAYISTDSLRREIDGALTVRDIVVENRAPTVDAGGELNVLPNQLVNLRATADDADGRIVSYQWRQISGPGVTLQGASSATPSFRATFGAPRVFEVTVTDDRGATASDTVQVAITFNAPPPPICWEGGVATICPPRLF